VLQYCDWDAVNSFSFASDLLGPYRILEMIDKGGMSLVYRAIDSRDDTIVALKLLYPYLLLDPEMVQRFQREAKIIKSLNHPHIVALHDFGEQDGLFYLAMRYMAGGSLAKQYKTSAFFDLATALKILKQIASALDYAHARQVIHRDLKLENVLLDENGDSALSDFGIARVVGGTRYTQTGNLTGSPHYMSPEQAQGKIDVDYRSDLYSLAVMTYRICVGTFPFVGSEALVILNQHLVELPPMPSSVNPTLPREVDYVLWRGLAKSPLERYESAAEFVEAFERAFSAPINTPIKAALPDSPAVLSSAQYPTREGVATVFAQPPAHPSRRVMPAALMLLVVLGLLAGLFFARSMFMLPDASATAVNTLVITQELSAPSATSTLTPSRTIRQTQTFTATLSRTPTRTHTPPPTATATFTRTPSPTATPMPTDTVVPPTFTSIPPTPVPASPTPLPPTADAALPNIVPTLEQIIPTLLPKVLP
jgi:serine/threonine-protein kinase